MNIFKSIGNAFVNLGGVLAKAFALAKAAGLIDDIVTVALPYVRDANKKFVDNSERREWVVAALIARKVPESVARIAVELAYQLYRKEVGKVIGA